MTFLTTSIKRVSCISNFARRINRSISDAQLVFLHWIHAFLCAGFKTFRNRTDGLFRNLIDPSQEELFLGWWCRHPKLRLNLSSGHLTLKCLSSLWCSLGPALFLRSWELQYVKVIHDALIDDRSSESLVLSTTCINYCSHLRARLKGAPVASDYQTGLFWPEGLSYLDCVTQTGVNVSLRHLGVKCIVAGPVVCNWRSLIWLHIGVGSAALRQESARKLLFMLLIVIWVNC